MNTPISSSDVYTDMAGLQSLKYRAGKDSEGALRETAEKYEAAFLQMMLKAMRKTTSGEGLFDSDQTRFYQDMFDNQIAQDLAKRGQIGIADMMMTQLSRKDKTETSNDNVQPLNFEQLRIRQVKTGLSVSETASMTTSDSPSEAPSFKTPQEFIEQLWPMAEKHAATLGVEPEVLLAQAALETGWGKYVIQGQASGSSHNLFNIKADARWQGEIVDVSTLEYRDGVARREQASFRAYPDFEASFADYAAFIQSGERYKVALDNAGDSKDFIRSLHQAGYATDPEYSSKISKIMSSEVFGKAVGEVKNLAMGPLT